MIVYHAKEFESAAARSHPWSVGLLNETHQYVNFKEHPELIRSALEDWFPYKEEDFAESFFQLLEWLNGPDSLLETNDCAFLPSASNIDKQFKFKKRCSGRLMILFRDVIENTRPESIDWLFNELLRELVSTDKEFNGGAVGFSFMECVYTELPTILNQGTSGFQIMLSMFAYGKNRGVVYENMNRIILNLRHAFIKINGRLINGELA